MIKTTEVSRAYEIQLPHPSVVRDTAILIPSLEPTIELIDYIKQLTNCGFQNIIVVNDGSNHNYDSIFQQIDIFEACTVLVHPLNLGKGTALKTGYAYIQEHLPQCTGVISVDSDGQHAIEDVCHMASALSHYPKTLLLGCRDFSHNQIPVKSRVGNRISSALFFLLFGKWLSDTQTGLRAFDSSLLSKMISIDGTRFEYEMRVLAICSTEKIPIERISIQTIYNENNEGTHFQAVGDSMKIAKVLLGSIGSYSLSSGLSTIADILIAWFLLDFLLPHMPIEHLLRIGLSTTIARIISMIINYTLNKKFVFKEDRNTGKSSMRYILLCVANMILSTAFIYTGFATFGINDKLLKLISNAVLFCINYQVQRKWVFRKEKYINGKKERI